MYIMTEWLSLSYIYIYIYYSLCHFWHKVPKPFGVFCAKSYEGVFGYVNKVTFGKPFEAILGLDWLPGNQPYD